MQISSAEGVGVRVDAGRGVVGAGVSVGMDGSNSSPPKPTFTPILHTTHRHSHTDSHAQGFWVEFGVGICIVMIIFF